MIAVVDTIRKIAASTAKKYGKEIYFFHGHILEIAAELMERSKTAEYRKKKYPSLILLEDFVETHNTNTAWDMEANLQILIVASSDINYTPDLRIEKVYKPVLYPICDAFVYALQNSVNIQSIPKDNLKYQKIDRHRCTSAFNEAAKAQKLTAIFADHLDAVEINLNIKITKNC
jgi:hypothetical protein